MKFTILLILLVLPHYLAGQNNSNTIPFEIADFYHFKKGAITFTFDDAVSSQFSVGVKILNKFNFKGTFFVVTDCFAEGCGEIMQELVKNGHEIGSHTSDHAKLSSIDIDSASIEIEKSKNTIEQYIKGYLCFSFAYPNGAFNESICKIVSKTYQAARSGIRGFNSVNESYYFTLPTYIVTPKTKLSDIKEWVNGAMIENKWLIETYHGFDGDGYQPVTSDFFLNHLQYIKSKEDYLWIAPFRDVVKYFKERKSTTIKLTDSVYNFYSFSIKDDLPDSIYDFPLTLRFKIPKLWNNVTAQQNNMDLGCQLQTDVYNNKYAVFDAVPDRGSITIIADDVTSDSTNCKQFQFTAFPNPFSQNLTLLSNASDKGEFWIYNSKGACVKQCNVSSEIKILDTSTWQNGVYIIKFELQGTSNTIIKKVVKQ